MNHSIYDKLTIALAQAESHNSQVMVKPAVILWPDPESQWASVIDVLQDSLPQLLVYGTYDPVNKQGPAIWLKCMIAQALPEADWDKDATPIIYMPGVVKADLRNVEQAVFNLQPLLEYQYTGTLFMQDNGREWTILAMIENTLIGLGLKVAHDVSTKEALKKTLPHIFQDREVFTNKAIIEADFLNSQLFPDIIPSILKWMCKGDSFLQAMEAGKQEVFINLCSSQYDFYPDAKNIKAIAEKLGSQRNGWKYVWQFYATAPQKFPEIEDLLRLAKPADLGVGIFALPEESWPQVNEQREEALALALTKVSGMDAIKGVAGLEKLEAEHGVRRAWVWFELGYSPLLDALQYLLVMAQKTQASFPHRTIAELKEYYITEGYIADQSMRKALAAVKTERDTFIVTSIIRLFYHPWMESLTFKFQKLVEQDASIFTSQTSVQSAESYILFVDAFRFELASEFRTRLEKFGWKSTLEADWTAIPSVTPTAKPHVSPIASAISVQSEITDFRPQLQQGKDLQTQVFRDALKTADVKFVTHAQDIDPNARHWQEIGDIDTKGHEEQAGMVKRIGELFEQIEETLSLAFERGIKKVRIVTDHGWLLLPGGLPKTVLHAGLTETRWGRCALIKEHAATNLMHLPWRWNPSIYIAYAPGISFFKANVEYAHGGISLHECLIPVMTVEGANMNKETAELKTIKWVNLRCIIQTTLVIGSFTVDIRTKFNDPQTSIVLSKDKKIQGDSVSLLVDDSAEDQAATIVLLDEQERILDRKPTTVGGH